LIRWNLLVNSIDARCARSRRQFRITYLSQHFIQSLLTYLFPPLPLPLPMNRSAQPITFPSPEARVWMNPSSPASASDLGGGLV
jgi:hypothetical protein